MPPVPPAWADRWLAWRNRLVASPRFQRWAAGFPLTRRIAQRNTRTLFDLCAGFVYARVLTACIRLDLFAILADGPQTVDALARRLDLTPDAARRLLRAAALSAAKRLHAKATFLFIAVSRRVCRAARQRDNSSKQRHVLNARYTKPDIHVCKMRLVTLLVWQVV